MFFSRKCRNMCSVRRKWWFKLGVNEELMPQGGGEFVLMAGETVHSNDGVY